MADDHVHWILIGDSAQHRSDGTGHLQRQAMVVAGDHFHTNEGIEAGARRRTGQDDLDASGSCPAQSVDRVGGHQRAGLDDGHPVGQALHLVKVMGGKEHGATLGHRLPCQTFEFVLQQRVEARGRLIEDQQFWAVHEGQNQANLLPIAARKIAHWPVSDHAEALHQCANVRTVGTATRSGEPLDVLGSGEPGVEGQVPREVADTPVDLQTVGHRVQAEDAGRTRRRALECEEEPDRRRLPCAVGAEESEHLCRAD